MGALLGHYGLLLGGGGSGGGGYQAETTLWESRINALGGSVTTTEKDLADVLVVQLKAASYASKIKYLLPFIGATIAAHRVPLIDVFNVGAASNIGAVGFTDADCDTATGIVNSTEKSAYLDTKIAVTSLNSSNFISGGLGFWERNWGAGTNVEPIGTHNSADTDRFVIDLRSSFQRFRWGDVTGTQAGPATTAGNHHYYGQRDSSAVTKIYADGSDLGSHGTSSTAGDTATIFVMGCNYPGGTSVDTPWKGRCAVAYLTDGTLADADVAALHTLLGTYLVTPTGR